MDAVNVDMWSRVAKLSLAVEARIEIRFWVGMREFQSMEIAENALDGLTSVAWVDTVPELVVVFEWEEPLDLGNPRKVYDWCDEAGVKVVESLDEEAKLQEWDMRNFEELVT
jgi:hypothetical protein